MIPIFVFKLLLVSGCSTQPLTALQLTQTIESSTLSSPRIKDAEKSSQKVVTTFKNKSMISLDDYRWKKRLLLVFAPKEDAAYQKQMQFFKEQQAGFDERDLLVVQLLAEGTSRIDSQPIDSKLAAQIRERFNVGQQEFQVILVGKDGTSKRRDRTFVLPGVIFKEIDAMPMRQQEMRSPSN